MCLCLIMQIDCSTERAWGSLDLEQMHSVLYYIVIYTTQGIHKAILWRTMTSSAYLNIRYGPTLKGKKGNLTKRIILQIAMSVFLQMPCCV